MAHLALQGSPPPLLELGRNWTYGHSIHHVTGPRMAFTVRGTHLQVRLQSSRQFQYHQKDIYEP